MLLLATLALERENVIRTVVDSKKWARRRVEVEGGSPMNPTSQRVTSKILVPPYQLPVRSFLVSTGNINILYRIQFWTAKVSIAKNHCFNSNKYHHHYQTQELYIYILRYLALVYSGVVYGFFFKIPGHSPRNLRPSPILFFFESSFPHDPTSIAAL